MDTTGRSGRNDLLNALSREELSRIEEHLVRTEVEDQQLLCATGRYHPHVYFPETAVVSLRCGSARGESIDVAVTGCDGLIGATFGPFDPWNLGSAVVSRAGSAWRLPLALLHAEIQRGGMLAALVRRYQDLLMLQMAQAALCSKVHRVEEQLARWILGTLDLCGTDCLQVTQQQIADALGVRREGISSAVKQLEARCVLQWGRGRLRVKDRSGLERQSCGCYRALLQSRERVLGASSRGR